MRIHGGLLGLGDANSVAQTIQKIEGYFPGSLSYKNNNPGNLRPAGQPGCVPSGGFCTFATYDDGYAALVRDLTAKANRGMTIQDAINMYAPASDGNNPTSYAATLAASQGLSVSDPLLLAMSGSSSAGAAPPVPGLTTAGDSSSDDSTDTSDTVQLAGVDVPVDYLMLGAAAIAGLVIWRVFA